MNFTRSSTDSMTNFHATLVNAGYGQLALRDGQGRVAQKWTLSQPKCVIGSNVNCNVRCLLPGIADHHVLLVVGAKQIFMRALTPGIECDGKALNELVLSGEQVEFAFNVAGHRFEYVRQSNAIPAAPAFIQESLASANPAGKAARTSENSPAASGERLKFTFVRALERNRDRQAVQGSGQVSLDNSATSDRPAWVEEIVRDALRPVEMRLENIVAPIHNLERQLRRQRARLRKQKQRLSVSRQGAHELPDPHTRNLIESQEAIQKIVRDQSVRLETVGERVGDIVSQLAALERIVSAETDQHSHEVQQSTQSGEEIMRLQREMLELINAYQARMAEPAATDGQDQAWRESVQRQLDELHESLETLADIKSALETTVEQNRELTQDFHTRWQELEEAVRRPVVIQTAPPVTAPPVAAPEDAAPVVAPSVWQVATPVDAPVDAPTETAEPIFNAPVSDVFELPPSLATDAMTASSSRVESALPEAAELPQSLPAWWSDDPVERSQDDALEASLPNAYGEYTTTSPSPARSFVADQPEPEVDDLGRSAILPETTTNERAGSSDSLGFAAEGREDSYHDSDYASHQSTDDSAASDGIGAQYQVESAQDAYSASLRKDESNYFQSGPDDEISTAPATVPEGLGSLRTEYEWQSPVEPTRDDYAQEASSAEVDGDDYRSEFSEPSGYVKSAFSAEELAIETPLADLDAPAMGEMESASPRHFDVDSQLGARIGIDAANDLDSDLNSDLDSELDSGLAAGNDSDPAMISGRYEQADYTRHEDDDRRDDQLSNDQLSDEPVRHAWTSREPDMLPAAASLAHHSAPVAPAGGDEAVDESVEDYMRRLLARMRGVSETEVQLPGLESPAVAPTPQRRHEAPKAFAPVLDSTEDSVPDYASETLSEAWTEPFDPEKYVPRGAAPERNRNIDALRDLANTSARSAIQTSARRRHGTAILVKSAVALVGLAAGLALVGINGFRVNIALIATIASFLVAVIWGYDAIATLRPLLQTSHHAKARIQAPPSDEADSEVESL